MSAAAGIRTDPSGSRSEDSSPRSTSAATQGTVSRVRFPAPGACRPHRCPRRRTAGRRAGPPGRQARSRRRRTPPPPRRLPGQPCRATRAAAPDHRGRAPPPRPGPPPWRPHTRALLRLVVEDVPVTGWHVHIRIRSPSTTSSPHQRTPTKIPISPTRCQLETQGPPAATLEPLPPGGRDRDARRSLRRLRSRRDHGDCLGAVRRSCAAARVAPLPPAHLRALDLRGVDRSTPGLCHVP
jgi:hypothetical protein